MFRRDSNEMNDPKELSVLALPKDVIKHAISLNVANNQAVDIKGAIANLAKTCKSWNSLFQPELNHQRWQQLIAYILYPTQHALIAIINIAMNNPKLFFITANEITDYANHLNTHRSYTNYSPYQLLFASGDAGLLILVKPHLNAYLDKNNQVEKVIHNHAFAYQQVLDKFPHGFIFPPNTTEFTQALLKLVKAVNTDEQLKQNNSLSEKTFQLQAEFAKLAFNKTVKTGHPFNMNNIIQLLEVCSQNWDSWGKNQRQFVSINLIGLLQSFMAQGYLIKALHGFQTIKLGLSRNYEIACTTNPNKKILVLPFDANSANGCLGSHFLIDSYQGRVMYKGYRLTKEFLQAFQSDLKKQCDENALLLLPLMQLPVKPASIPRTIF